MSCFVGIDLGGTSVKVGVLTHAGRILAKENRVLPSDRSPASVVAHMVTAARAVVAAAGLDMARDIAAVGIGAPGACGGGAFAVLL